MIISGGENIYPAEVERVLREHADVERDVCVVGWRIANGGKELPVAVITTSADSLSSDHITEFMQDKKLAHKQPRQIIFLEDMPRNAMNKIVVEEVKDRIKVS